MDKQKRFTRPFLLALALHLTLLGLFSLSALYKPAVKEEPEPPAPEIIHATMIDTASLQAEAEAIKKAESVKKQATKEQLDAAQAKEKAEVETKQAELEKAKAEAAEQAKAEAAKQVKAEAAEQAKAEAAKQAKAEAAELAKAEAARQAKA